MPRVGLEEFCGVDALVVADLVDGREHLDEENDVLQQRVRLLAKARTRGPNAGAKTKIRTVCAMFRTLFV